MLKAHESSQSQPLLTKIRSEHDVKVERDAKVFVWKSVFFLISWSIVSGGIILLNKYIFVKDDFPYPITVSATGPLCSWIVAAGLIAIGKVEIENRITMYEYVTIILPIGLFSAITFASGNTLYLYLSVSFIQMIKSLSPVVVFSVLVLLGMDKPTFMKSFGVVITSFGMLVACLSESRLTSFGIALIATSEASECIRMVFFQHMLYSRSFGVIEGLFYSAPANFMFLTLFTVIFEYGEIVETEAWRRPLANPIPYIVVAFFGFFVNITTIGVIQTCGSITFKAAGQVRNASVIMLASWLYNEKQTLVQLIGYVVSIVGFFIYQNAKSREDLDTIAKSAEFMAGEPFTPSSPIWEDVGEEFGWSNSPQWQKIKRGGIIGSAFRRGLRNNNSKNNNDDQAFNGVKDEREKILGPTLKDIETIKLARLARSKSHTGEFGTVDMQRSSSLLSLTSETERERRVERAKRWGV
jgi:drug/metabolite transporter (DMT)-like permease